MENELAGTAAAVPNQHQEQTSATPTKCPVTGGARRHTVAGAPTNAGLVAGSAEPEDPAPALPLSDPMDKEFNYAEEFKSLDLDAVIKDLHALMTTSQDWWPATMAIMGRFSFVMAWHSAGTYRIGDAAAGQAPAHNVLRPSIAGRTTRTSIRRAGCSGRSSRSMGGNSPGPTL